MEINYFRDKLLDFLNGRERIGIADLDVNERNSLLTVGMERLKELPLQIFTGKIAETGQILHKGKYHRETLAGVTYYYKG